MVQHTKQQTENAELELTRALDVLKQQIEATEEIGEPDIADNLIEAVSLIKRVRARIRSI